MVQSRSSLSPLVHPLAKAIDAYDETMKKENNPDIHLYKACLTSVVRQQITRVR